MTCVLGLLPIPTINKILFNDQIRFAHMIFNPQTASKHKNTMFYNLKLLHGRTYSSLFLVPMEKSDKSTLCFNVQSWILLVSKEHFLRKFFYDLNRLQLLNKLRTLLWGSPNNFLQIMVKQHQYLWSLHPFSPSFLFSFMPHSISRLNNEVYTGTFPSHITTH